MGIPVVAIADTSCNPDEIDYPIPANDDAIRAIKLICNKIADSILEGLSAGQVITSETETKGPEPAAAGTAAAVATAPAPQAVNRSI